MEIQTPGAPLPQRIQMEPLELCCAGSGLELQKPWMQAAPEEHRAMKSLSLIPPINLYVETKYHTAKTLKAQKFF